MGCGTGLRKSYIYYILWMEDKPESLRQFCSITQTDCQPDRQTNRQELRRAHMQTDMHTYRQIRIHAVRQIRNARETDIDTDKKGSTHAFYSKLLKNKFMRFQIKISF